MSASGIETRDRAGAYDGFVSYSHAADDLLAPRLQAGLQRFATPWWKRRGPPDLPRRVVAFGHPPVGLDHPGHETR